MAEKKKRNHRRLGSVYEQTVGFYLEQYGYEIVAFNYRCPMGEIDLIAKEGGVLVFCEVKYRKIYIAEARRRLWIRENRGGSGGLRFIILPCMGSGMCRVGLM